jgi:hypothetical protein
MATKNRFIVDRGVDNNNKTLTNVADPVNAQDAATKNSASNASNLTTGTVDSARLPTVGTPVTDALVKATTDAQGRVTGTTPVSANDINSLNKATATLASTSQAAVATFAASGFDSAKIVVKAVRGTDFQVQELMVGYDGTTVYTTSYSTLDSGTSLATFDMDVSGSDIRLLATPSSATSTTFVTYAIPLSDSLLANGGPPGGGTPGGSTTQVQYNNAGAFAGSSSLTFNSGTGALSATSFAGSGAALTALNASNLSTGTVGTARLGTGSASSTTYLRGDGTWATPAGGSATGFEQSFLLMGA